MKGWFFTWLLGAVLVAAQPFGLTNRVANTTLRMPPAPPVYTYSLVNAFGNLTFTDPLAIVGLPRETNRLFILEHRGRVALITNLAAPTRTVFLDLSSRVVGGTSGDERGLLGLAVHPGFATNGYIYVYYSLNTNSAGGSGLHQRLARFQRSTNNPNAADPQSELVLIDQFDQANNHNGGCLQFGPDGYLYFSMGDEGNQNDYFNNSQRIDKDFFSAISRIDVDDRPSSLAPNPHPANTNNPTRTIHYRIPADNPWVNATSFNGLAVDPDAVRTEFYAVGLRNPWRFSFDPATGDLYCGDVGGSVREEIDVIVKGGNYGWNYREGNIAGPEAPTPGFASINPILDYGHGSGTNQGNSVTGGVVYRGTRLGQLTGAYIFADYVSGNVWALRYNGTNAGGWQRLLNEGGIAGFGVDPRNGDVLLADLSGDVIRRLEYSTNSASGLPLPATLADTGAFDDVATLTPAAGVVPYDINVSFWSDHAGKQRWCSVPGNLKITFSRDNNWNFPTGTVWVKHFELELTNGVAESARRLETRLLVKNATGLYGVTYRWGDSVTNAVLVPDEGLDESFVVNAGGILRTQIWHYPGRAECLTCHTARGGWALGFNTAQLNRDVTYGSVEDNQLRALNHAGYFNTNVTGLHLLRSLAHATNEAWSREWRVRSYLAANCVQCHQPGGLGLGSWNARPSVPLSAAGLIDGLLNDNGGDPNNRVIVPGSLANSMLLTRISTRGPGQMPPLASSVIDTQAVALISAWITNDLPGYRTFAQWQLDHFSSTNAPDAEATADADHDRAKNLLEWLTGTDPLDSSAAWGISLRRNGDAVQLEYQQAAGRGFEVQWSTDPADANAWAPLDVPGNRPFYSASDRATQFFDVLTNAPARFYRVRVFEP